MYIYIYNVYMFGYIQIFRISVFSTPGAAPAMLQQHFIRRQPEDRPAERLARLHIAFCHEDSDGPTAGAWKQQHGWICFFTDLRKKNVNNQNRDLTIKQLCSINKNNGLTSENCDLINKNNDRYNQQKGNLSNKNSF